MNACGVTGAVHLVSGSALAVLPVSKMSCSNISSPSNTSALKEKKDVCCLVSCCSGVGAQKSSETGMGGDSALKE